MVDQHQNYWMKELEKTREIDKERCNDLKERLKKEEKIRNKIFDLIKHMMRKLGS